MIQPLVGVGDVAVDQAQVAAQADYVLLQRADSLRETVNLCGQRANIAPDTAQVLQN